MRNLVGGGGGGWAAGESPQYKYQAKQFSQFSKWSECFHSLRSLDVIIARLRRENIAKGPLFFVANRCEEAEFSGGKGEFRVFNENRRSVRGKPGLMLIDPEISRYTSSDENKEIKGAMQGMLYF